MNEGDQKNIKSIESLQNELAALQNATQKRFGAMKEDSEAQGRKLSERQDALTVELKRQNEESKKTQESIKGEFAKVAYKDWTLASLKDKEDSLRAETKSLVQKSSQGKKKKF